MSEDPTVAPSRFSILVPEPPTRLNMGKPAGGEDAFGYPGISLQAEDHLFVSVAKTAHLQASFRMHLQAGDHWDQFAYKNMTLAANFNSTLGANGKVIVAAGAGQGNFPTIPTGSGAPPWIDYNNLKLHYIIDTVSTGLKELFYGGEWATHQKLDADTQKPWSASLPPPMTGGMISNIDKVLCALGFDRATDGPLFAALSAPMKWAPDFVSAQGKAMPWNWASSEYKFLIKGDPYAPSAVMGVGIPRVLTKVMAYFLQTGVLLRRLADGLEALIPSIMEFEVIARIRGLVAATRAFNDALLKMDPAEWKKFDPTATDNAWTQVRKHSFEPFEEGTWRKTRAELTSSHEPFPLATCHSFELEILDKEGGTPAIVDFAALGSPASVTLKVEGKFLAIRIPTAIDGTVSLDGTTAAYTAHERAWRCGAEDGLPEGFVFDTAAGTLTKGGELFEASAPSANFVVEDRTFSSGSLALVVDGTAYAVPGVASLNAVGATARAMALAAKLQGIGGVTATASGHSVVVTSPTVGATSTLALSTSISAHAELGLEGEGVGGAATLTAAELKDRLMGKGHYTVALAGQAPNQWLEIAHDLDGKESYLEFSGGPAKAFFGKDPASAKGTDPGHSTKDIKPLFDALFETMEGNSVQALIRPVFDCMEQVTAVWGKIEEAAKGLQAFLAPQKALPHLALTAGPGGVTIATNGPVNEVGHSISLVAAGAMTEPNMKKFVPVIEDIMHGVEVANEKIAHALWHNPYEAALVPPGHGTLNLISSGATSVISSASVRMYSGADVEVVSVNARLAAATSITLGAHTGSVVLKGPTVQIGDVTPSVAVGANKQKPTENVVITASTGAVRVHTDAVGAWLDEGKKRAALGTRKSADGSLDDAQVHLSVEPTKATLGDADDALTLGGGTVTLKGKTKVILQGGSNVDLEATGGQVKIHGKLDVGGVLSVSGVPVPAMPEIHLAIDAAAAATLATVRAEYAALGAVVETLQAARVTADQAIEKVRQDLVPMLPSAQATALAAAEAVRGALSQQLAVVESKLAEVEAKLLGVDRADLVKRKGWWS